MKIEPPTLPADTSFRRSYLEQEARDRDLMATAIEQAHACEEIGEVPVGAIVVVADRVIARAGNRRECRQDPTAHAEMIAIRKAALRLGTWRLTDATVYSTLEPCPMCMGALVHARVSRLVFGCHDTKWGAAGSLYDLTRDPRLNHRMRVMSGVEEEACRALLQDFFRTIRRQRAADRAHGA